jgi:hypothetical protein
LKENWIADVCKHMVDLRKPKDYWTKEKCRDEALRYTSRSDFNRYSISAYSKAWEMKWLDEICKHMDQKGNKYKRCIYVYEFSDSNVYVGLTFDLNKRNKQHQKRGPVFNHRKLTGLEPILRKLTDYIEVEIAKFEESEYIKKYKEDGYKLLNKSTAGACGGGVRKWTKDRCKKDALLYDDMKDYREKGLSYRATIRNKWVEEICKHMKKNKKNKSGYWTKEMCREISSMCKTKAEFNKLYPGGYHSSLKNGWIDEICAHMPQRKTKPKGYWTKERCSVEALKYEKRSHLQKNNVSAYQTALNNGWLDEICHHMY